MTKPPPTDLRDWGKTSLILEVERLRAILHEHAETRGGDPRAATTGGGAVIDVSEDPYSRHGALIDVRNAVLLDSIDVSLVEEHRDGPVVFLALGGRINYSPERVEHAYLFGPDGAAGIVTELIALARRAESHDQTSTFAQDFAVDFARRMADLP